MTQGHVSHGTRRMPQWGGICSLSPWIHHTTAIPSTGPFLKAEFITSEWPGSGAELLVKSSHRLATALVYRAKQNESTHCGSPHIHTHTHIHTYDHMFILFLSVCICAEAVLCGGQRYVNKYGYIRCIPPCAVSSSLRCGQAHPASLLLSTPIDLILTKK